jgi:hypothetical protein
MSARNKPQQRSSNACQFWPLIPSARPRMAPTRSLSPPPTRSLSGIRRHPARRLQPRPQGPSPAQALWACSAYTESTLPPSLPPPFRAALYPAPPSLVTTKLNAVLALFFAPPLRLPASPARPFATPPLRRPCQIFAVMRRAGRAPSGPRQAGQGRSSGGGGGGGNTNDGGKNAFRRPLAAPSIQPEHLAAAAAARPQALPPRGRRRCRCGAAVAAA